MKKDGKPGCMRLWVYCWSFSLSNSLYETVEEITESYIHKSYSVIGIISSVISIALAVLLLFNPFEHFSFHVRILGLGMIASVISNRINAQ